MEGLLHNSRLFNSSIFGPAGGSNIESIQRGSEVLTATSTNVTISSVVVANCMIKIRVYDTTASVDINSFTVGPSLTGATTLNLVREDNTHNVTVYWEIVEFINVTLRQSGSESLESSSHDISITTVVPTDCIVSIWLYSIRGGNPDFSEISCGYSLTTTTLTIYADDVANQTIYWEIVEM